jgi:predicted RND superfamily exporter protein
MLMLLTDKILKFRLLSIFLTVLLTLAAGYFAGSLKQDNSYESFFAADDPAYTELQEHYKTYGNDDFVFLLIDSHGRRDAAFLKRLDSLAARLEQEVTYADKVTWLGNAEAVTAESGSETVRIAPLFENLDMTAAETEQALVRAAEDPACRNRLISADGNIFGIVISFVPYPEAPDGSVNAFRNLAPPEIYRILGDFGDLDVRVVGMPVISYFNDRDIQEEGETWILTGIISMLVLLLMITRSIMSAVIPLLTVVLSIVLTMGLCQICGFTLNMLAMMIPILILCAGIGDSVHLAAEFRSLYVTGVSRRAALRQAIKLTALPMALTTLTTALGFASFVFADLLPLRELGAEAAVGAIAALALTFFLALPLLSFSRVKPLPAGNQSADILKKERRFDWTDVFIKPLAALVMRFPRGVILAFMVITGIAAYGLTDLKIETAFIQDLPENDPLRQDFNFEDSRMGGSMSVEAVISAGRENGVKDLSFIANLDKLKEFIDGHPLVLETAAFTDQLRQVNRAVHNNDEKRYAIPDNQALANELMLLYESGGGRKFDQLVSLSYDAARIQIRTKALSTADVRKLESDITAFVRTETPDLNLKFTGASSLLTRVADYLAASQLKSFLYAFITILAVMTAVFRSLKLGLLAMIPNVIPVLITLGLMGYAGCRLNMVLVILAPIILGVCIDDTIHFIVRFRLYFRECGCYRQAYLRALLSAGRTLIFTTVISGGCLLSFLNSKYAGPVTFAWSSFTAFAAALICDFTVTPALIMVLKPFGREATQNTPAMPEGAGSSAGDRQISAGFA